MSQKAKLKEQPLLDHLVELRNRLVWCVGFFSMAFMGCYFFSQEIFLFLTRPLINALDGNTSHRFIYTGLGEAFFTYIKIAFYGAFFLSCPLILHQIWRFIAPGLHKTEAKTVRPLLIASPLLFLTGAIFAYAAVLPMAWSFFVGFEVPVAQDQMAIMLEPRMTEYLSLTMVLLIAFGLSFELPILLILLAKIGLITAKSLQSKRRYAIILIFVMAAVLTPPDVVSQIALAFPLLILYEITLFLIRRMEQKQPSIQTEEQASA